MTNETYTRIRAAVSAAGFDGDIEWQRGVSLERVTASGFLREFAFVVANSGMRATDIAKLWPRLRAAFGDFADPRGMLALHELQRAAALRVLNSPPKIDAILAAVARMEVTTWDTVRACIEDRGIKYLRTWKYMGPVIVYHLAKNIGLPVAKPDRHLVRLAALYGEEDVQAFCGRISAATGDSVPVVDLVLWRFAASVAPGDYLVQAKDDYNP